MAYLIGEIGSNYETTDDIFKAIPIARDMKIDCFKVQWFSEFDLYGDGSKERQFSLDIIKSLRHSCDAHGIDFMCTAFSVEGYKLIDPFVTKHKIACSERNDPRIVSIVGELSKKDLKEIFISILPNETKPYADTYNRLRYLLCVPEYPCKRLPLEDCFGFDGISDHTNTIEQSITALKMVDVLEKHWNPFGYTDTPDACCSISNSQMQKLSDSRFINETWTNKYERQPNGYRPRF